jgi:hypothetical protein
VQTRNVWKKRAVNRPTSSFESQDAALTTPVVAVDRHDHLRSLPHVARLIDEYTIESLSEQILWKVCESGASPWDLDFLLSRTAPDWEKAVASAARGGHLHVFRWMAERQDGRGPWEADFDWVVEEAARNGHLELIKWLRERVASCTGARVFTSAAIHGQLAVLKWLHEQTTDDVASVAGDGMRWAARTGHLATVQ